MTFRYHIIIGFLIISSLLSCDSHPYDIEEDQDIQYVENEEPWQPTSISPEEYQRAIEIIQRRAHHIAEVKWHTLLAVPRNSGTFPADTILNGIPYSSVKELDKFVGHEVSFYTFLTAVQNPKSVLYSEHVGEPPYQGVNCAAYYGTVCSMAVNYVLGFDAPYQSNMYPDLPFIEKVAQQNPTAVRIGDILWKKGHVVLVSDVKFNDDGNISSIYILESMGSYTKIKEYTLSSFKNRWETSSWVLYRYLDFGKVKQQEQYSFLSSEDQDNFSIQYKSNVCTNRGDKACYREGEDIVLNLLHSDNGDASLFRDGMEFSTYSFEKGDLILSGLPAGKYEARVNTSSTIFEVIRASVKAKRAGGGVVVEFDGQNGIPEYVVLCTVTGARRYIHIITESELNSGKLWLNNKDAGIYVKVFFRGEYGRVSNEPIFLK